MEKAVSITEELVELFKVLSKPEAHRILFLAKNGISNSTSAMQELNISQKVYYDRLGGLVEVGLVDKIDGVYRQTPIGEIICSRFLPAMGGAYEIREKLGLLESLEGTTYEQKLRKVFADDLEILEFMGPAKVKMIDDYESMVIDVIDMCDEAERSIMLASNYFDVRVMEATFRSLDRGVTNRIIAGKQSLSSKFQRLAMMLSLRFSKVLINVFTNFVNLEDFVRFTELDFSFCVVDGHRSMVIISNLVHEKYVVAFSIDDRGVAKRLADLYEELWEMGDSNPALKFLSSLKKT